MKPERMIPQDQALDILASCNLGTLSMVTPDGLPYGVPINYSFDAKKNALYLHCAIKGKKLDCLNYQPMVSFSVYRNPTIVEEKFTTHYESVLVTGRAEVLSDPEEKRKVLFDFSMALAPAGAYRLEEVIDKYWHAVAIIKIAIEKMEGKRNMDM